MAKHAEKVMAANGVENIVTVIQGAVEEIKLPIEEDEARRELASPGGFFVAPI